MAGKHQIWSSSKRTRSRANRCWRRQARERLRNEATTDASAPRPDHAGDPKTGALVYADNLDFGTSIADLMPSPVEETPTVDPGDFARMLTRWQQFTIDDYARVLPELPRDLLLDWFQMIQVDPLEQFLALSPAQQARLVACLAG